MKEIEDCDIIEKILTKNDISDLESSHLTESEKQDILKKIWNIVSRKFYEYRIEVLASSKGIL